MMLSLPSSETRRAAKLITQLIEQGMSGRNLRQRIKAELPADFGSLKEGCAAQVLTLFGVTGSGWNEKAAAQAWLRRARPARHNQPIAA